MRGLIRGCAVLAVSLVVGGQATNSGQKEQPLLEFSCRASEIYGGQHDAGALIDTTPGNPNPLRFFRVGKDARGVDIIVPSESSFLSAYAKVWAGWPGRLPFHFYWSASGDFLVWVDQRIWFWRGASIIRGGRPEFEPINYDLKGSMYSLDDVVPEHIDDTARLAGDTKRRHLIEFNLRTGTFRRLPISVGLHPFSGLAWTSNDTFLRVRHHIVRGNLYLDIFDSKARQWTKFSPQMLPLGAKLLMFRLNPRDKTPEAIISWPDRENVDRIGSITRGATTPKVLVSGQFEHIHVSPDRTQLLGVTEVSGRFHRLKGEPYSPRVSFWLTKFERMNGLEKFYLQENARYAFVKINDSAAGTEIAVWERKGDEAEPIGTICAERIDPAIDRQKSTKAR